MVKRTIKSDEKPAQEAIDRKNRSIEILRDRGVKVLDALPVIEIEAETKRRDEIDVALRAICLSFVAVKGEGMPNDRLGTLIKAYEVEDSFSPKEIQFVADPSPSQHDRIQFLWRYESFAVMLWALGYLDDLDPPDKIVDAATVTRVVSSRIRGRFINEANLRPQAEILDAADLAYRYHWASVDARINNRLPQGSVTHSITFERLYAFNWLIGYMDQEWDDISTDT